MVKLINLIFISIPEAFAMSYFIWMLVGRSSYIDHKKIAICALASATALSASFESIDNFIIKAIYQVFIMLVLYYLCFRLRISQTIVSTFTLLLFMLIIQGIAQYTMNDVAKIGAYYTENGMYLKQFTIKLFSVIFEICVLFISTLLTRHFKVNLSALTKNDDYKNTELIRFLVSVFSLLLLVIPQFRLFDFSIHIQVTNILYLIVTASFYIASIAIISHEYMNSFVNTIKSTSIIRFQLDKQNSDRKEHEELVESADNVIELTFKDKK